MIQVSVEQVNFVLYTLLSQSLKVLLSVTIIILLACQCNLQKLCGESWQLLPQVGKPDFDGVCGI